MLLGFFGMLLLLFVAIAAVVWGLTPGSSLIELAKFLAVAVGSATLVVIGWPYARGIRKGDKVVVTEEPTKAKIMALFGMFNGKALDNGRLGGVIKVELFDGSIALGTITKYEGLLSNAEVRLLERRIPIEIRG